VKKIAKWLTVNEVKNVQHHFFETQCISVVVGSLQTLYRKIFGLLTGSFVKSKDCSLKNASIANCEQSTPTTVWPLSASLQHTNYMCT